MTTTGRTMIGTAVILGLLVSGSVFVRSAEKSGQRLPQRLGNHNIDPTADIHPSVILEGRVTVGAYTKIDAGTIIIQGHDATTDFSFRNLRVAEMAKR